MAPHVVIGDRGTFQPLAGRPLTKTPWDFQAFFQGFQGFQDGTVEKEVMEFVEDSAIEVIPVSGTERCTPTTAFMCA